MTTLAAQSDTADSAGITPIAPTGRLLGYARVSRHDQDVTLQLDALRAAGCGLIWTEKASGAVDARPELEDLLTTAAVGDVVVVWKLDRLARSVRHLLELVDELADRGVGLRSLTEGIDTTGPAGRPLLLLFGALAEIERGLIVDRTRAGLAAARARGRVGGRPSVMTAAKLKAAREMYDAGTTIAEIARVIDVSRRTLYRHLQPTP